MGKSYVIIDVKGHETFEEVLSRYRGLLFTICRHSARRGVDIDDLMQDIALVLWQNHEKLLSLSHGPGQAAWMWRVANNAAIDTLRRYRPNEQLPDNWDPPADDRSHLDDLHEQIDLLAEPDRTIVKMHLEGYNYQEIGKRLGITGSNVSVRLVRIKEKLRKSLTL